MKRKFFFFGCYSLGVISLLLVVMAVVLQSSPVALDAICAPVMPGSVLVAGKSLSVYDAPWWAPQPLKKGAYSICGSKRARSRLEVNYDKFTVYWLLGDTAEYVWNRRADGTLTVKADKLHLTKKHGNKEEFIAPWSYHA